MGTLAALFAIVWIVILFVGHGITISVLWGWFAVPIFGLPQINIPSSIGLAILASQFCGAREKGNVAKMFEEIKHDTDKFINFLLDPFIGMGITIILGYIFKLRL